MKNTTNTHYDIIGDIHGHAKELKQLLEKLGYDGKDDYYQHPEHRKVIFLGDFIDRGSEIRETLHIVKAMMDNGTAEAVMGNHEYNAICFHLKDMKNGGHLRKHSIKNIDQHVKTILEFKKYEEEWNDWVQWFMTLPVFIEKENFRVVHACWDDDFVKYLEETTTDGRINEEFIRSAQVKGTMNFESLECLLKGKEEELPNGLSFRDTENNLRKHGRVKWWHHPTGKTLGEFIFGDLGDIANNKIEADKFTNHKPYDPKAKPVFVGHYWLKDEPGVQTDNVCCVDYSVAKEGKLVAYQYSGEQKLESKNLVWYS